MEPLITDYLRCLYLLEHLRASTKEQDAKRAKNELIQFATDHGHKIATFYVENESGATLILPKLMLDMLAAIARKDYEDRCNRQIQGIARAKAEGRRQKTNNHDVGKILRSVRLSLVC